MFLAFGLMAALWEAQRSGKGQVVDTSMLEGSAYLMLPIYGMHGSGYWTDERGANILDTGAPFYGTYETKDGKHISIGSIEPKFYEELLEKSGMDTMNLPAQMDRENWPAMKETYAKVFKQKTRDEWSEIMEGADICFAPVLSMSEAPSHPHRNMELGTWERTSRRGPVSPSCQAGPTSPSCAQRLRRPRRQSGYSTFTGPETQRA